MRISSQIRTAFRNLQTSRLRAFLAMLSIMVGTASVVALISSGQLAAEEALKQFKSLGTNLMSINFAPTDTKKKSLKPVKPAMIEKMPAKIPDIYELAPYMTVYATGYFKEKSWDSTIIATTHTLADVISISMKQGRFFNKSDKSKSYCVVGQGVLDNLKTLSPVGKRIKLGNSIFTIIGVAEHWPENSFFSQDINQTIMVPIKTASLISSSAVLGDAVMKLRITADVDVVKDAITGFFAKDFPGFMVTIKSAKEMILRMAAQQQIFTLLLGLIGGIALFVGGIGVMNIMLASVAERRNEIGLRLALGAQPKDIQLMFIMESILLALIGGILGVILGILSTVLIAKIAGWSFTLFFFPPLIGLSVSILVTLFFGFYPAYKASMLNPIEALRGN